MGAPGGERLPDALERDRARGGSIGGRERGPIVRDGLVAFLLKVENPRQIYVAPGANVRRRERRGGERAFEVLLRHLRPALARRDLGHEEIGGRMIAIR